VDDAVNSNGRDEIHIKYGVCNSGNPHQEQCGAAEQNDVQVYAESGLGE
jgi:hypothetical protein